MNNYLVAFTYSLLWTTELKPACRVSKIFSHWCMFIYTVTDPPHVEGNSVNDDSLLDRCISKLRFDDVPPIFI